MTDRRMNPQFTGIMEEKKKEMEKKRMFPQNKIATLKKETKLQSQEEDKYCLNLEIYVHDPLGPFKYCNCIYWIPSMAIKHAKNSFVK